MSDVSSKAEGNPELRQFLRSRRSRISPGEAGLSPQPGARRVPGLRREEVAQLAGVSVDYYVRLERGRSLNASESVLDAVARALRLNDVERTHLFALARPSAAQRHPLPPQRVRPGLYRVLETMTETPAMVTGRRLDVLATNRMARVLLTDFDALPHRERNMARFMFLDEAARELYTDWETAARDAVAALHLYAGSHPHDPQLAELIGDLSLRDRDFRRWWADHDVLLRTNGTKRYHHPLVGDLTLGYEAFTPTGDPDQTFSLHTTEPGSPSEHALRLLAVWTNEQTTPDSTSRSRDENRAWSTEGR
ncbi:transcriptional regulator [Acrocarpospora corrugata]|uniref:Transcriptional regulator n=1 Tax=Acrocarpospora corrugata TaxID=35763 RepID=A0A5M3VZT7_9ACTN|nr:helix-turn-helix transcriptional regulator [Acrocarpospora corrugata]GES00603.1 transcriptional regulator [Acrocarpospora corrugata]